MVTMLRRLFLAGLLGGGGYAGWMFWQRRSDDTTDDAPEWPPLTTNGSSAASGSGSNEPISGFAGLPADDAAPPIEREPNPEAVPPGDNDTTLAEAMAAPDGPAPRWVDPVDGGCPDGYPVKANDNSGIYHVPGGRFYDRTVPERCYANTDDAKADDYRAAKS